MSALYPTDLLTEQQNKDKIDAALNKSRVDEMFNKRREFEKQLQHYLKVKKRWGQADVGIKVAGMILAGSGIMAGVIAPPLMILAPSVPVIIGALTVGEAVVTSGLVVGLTSRKKAFYREKIRTIQSYLDRMFVYIEKAKQDHVITIEELEGFRKLMDEYQTTVSGIKVSDYDYEKLKKQAKEEAEREVKETIKKGLVDGYVQSKLGAVSGALQRM